jgi:hypothetical protein
MDRLEMRKKFSSRVEKILLEEYGIELRIRPLSALERAKTLDKYRELSKPGTDGPATFEALTRDAQCYIVARGLVDENGAQIFREAEEEAVAAEIPGDALDRICKGIMRISGMDRAPEDQGKNLNPTLSAGFSSALQ